MKVTDLPPKPRYTLDELLDQYDETVPLSESSQNENRDWLNVAPFGQEVLSPGS